MPLDVDGTNHVHDNNIHVNNEITTTTEDNKVNNDNTVDEYLSKDLPIGVEISMDAIAQRVAKGSPIDYRQVNSKLFCLSSFFIFLFVCLPTSSNQQLFLIDLLLVFLITSHRSKDK